MTSRARIRNERIRKLHAIAVARGWTSEVDGGGHVKVTDPATGEYFTISATATDGNKRNYENTRAAARRAGLDVTNL